jgi:phage tail sheath gpL-like
MSAVSFPNVSIEEIIDGPLPVQQQALNRAVAVGKSKRGALGDVILVSSDTQLDDKIGRDLSEGSVGLQCARDEGATDTGFVRVLGAARSASAQFTIGGAVANVSPTETQTLNNPTLTGGANAIAATGTVTIAGTVTVGNVVTITIGGVAYDYTVVAGDTVNSIAAGAMAVINASNNGAGDPTVAATVSGAVVTLTAKTAGAGGNSITLAGAVAQGTGGSATVTATRSAATLATGAAAIAATATDTIGGTITADDRVVLIVTNGSTSRTYTYRVVAGNTTTNVAAGLVAAINAGSGDPDVTANNSAAVITLTAKTAGAAANAIQLTVITRSASSYETLTLTVIDGVVVKNYTVALTAAETALAIDAAFVTTVNQDAQASVVAVYDSVLNKIVLTAKTPGAAGNAIQYALAETGNLTSDLTINPTSGNLTGGLDGAAKASVTSGDLTLTAIGEGSDGNFIKYTFIPGTKAGTVDVKLTNSDNKSETITLAFTPGDLINGREIAALRSSITVRGVLSPNADFNNINLPTGTGFLSGGLDGSTITEDDYLAAIRLLATKRANIIFAPGQTSDAIRHALLAQAENATILKGLRIAILNAARRVDATSAATAATGYDTTTGSAVMVAGWATYTGQPRLPELGVSPDGFYVGALCATPEHVSPAARSSSPYFKTVGAVDTENDDVDFQAYTDGRLEALVLDPATNGYHRLNGRTLSSDAAEYYVCIRRMANRIKTDLYFASQAEKSEPKGGDLLQNIAAMAQTYLNGLAAVGKIKGGTIISAKTQGKGVRIDFQWYPVYPADEIDYGMHRLATDV